MLNMQRGTINNNFDHVPAWLRGKPAVGLHIRCSTCANTHTHALHSGAKSVSQPEAERIMRRLGWEVGRNRRHDRCPGCLQLVRDERAANRAAGQAKLADVMPAEVINLFGPKPDQSEESELKTTPIRAEPPREMSLEDRRIIFAKIHDVYLDAKTGYDNGWSDKKVATDLGVPQAWVAKIREENFGPDNSNAEARELAARIEKAEERMRGLKAESEALRAAEGAFDAKLSALNADLAAIRKDAERIVKIF